MQIELGLIARLGYFLVRPLCGGWGKRLAGGIWVWSSYCIRVTQMVKFLWIFEIVNFYEISNFVLISYSFLPRYRYQCILIEFVHFTISYWCARPKTLCLLSPGNQILLNYLPQLQCQVNYKSLCISPPVNQCLNSIQCLDIFHSLPVLGEIEWIQSYKIIKEMRAT